MGVPALRAGAVRAAAVREGHTCSGRRRPTPLVPHAEQHRARTCHSGGLLRLAHERGQQRGYICWERRSTGARPRAQLQLHKRAHRRREACPCMRRCCAPQDGQRRVGSGRQQSVWPWRSAGSCTFSASRLLVQIFERLAALQQLDCSRSAFLECEESTERQRRRRLRERTFRPVIVEAVRLSKQSVNAACRLDLVRRELRAKDPQRSAHREVS
jgi:hypothetical protein